MSYPAEAQIAREIFKFVANGLLYRGSKPVMWSVVEKTALAEAEIEYEELTSDAITAAFRCQAVVTKNSSIDFDKALWNDLAKLDEQGRPASIVIWTTTPWTIPGNRAIAYSPKVAYGLYRDLGAGGQLGGGWRAVRFGRQPGA